MEITKDFLELELKTKDFKQIANELNYHPETLRRKARSFGIVRSKHSHLINEDFFKSWSVNMAYILGFTFADGSVSKSNNRHKVVYQLNPKDIAILEFIRDQIQPTRTIYRYERIQQQTKKSFSVVMTDFSSRKIVEDLINLGCVEDKTHFEIRIPSMPECFKRHFIRGFFDGDGSVWVCDEDRKGQIKYGANFACTSIPMLLDIKSTINLGKVVVGTNPPTLQLYSKQDIKALYDFLYKEDGFFLDRKKKKFETAIMTTNEIRKFVKEQNEL